MRPSAYIAKIALSLAIACAACNATATSNTNALLAASEPVVLELNDNQLAIQTRPALVAGPAISSPIPAKVTAQRLPKQPHGGFDWTTLISISFGLFGLLWIRRRSADL